MPQTTRDRPTTLTLTATDEAATTRLGTALAAALAPGDVVCLSGPMGAGKSHLARAVIRARLGDAGAEVPSPTYTLVNVHDAPGGEVWHADLYRISEADELDELGLTDALDAAVVLVEWPERWPALPARRLEIALAPGAAPEARAISVTAHGPGWDRALAALRGRAAPKSERDRRIRAFLDAAGWQDAEIAPLAGDASNRRYLRLSAGADRAVLMDAPREKGEDIGPFVAVTGWLRDAGLSAPRLLGVDHAKGFLLLEDLGDALYAREVARDPACEEALYEAAIDVLVHLANQPVPDTMPTGAGAVALPPYDGAVLWREAGLLTEWWLPAATGAPVSRGLEQDYRALIDAATAEVEPDRSVVVLRDYHAENLLWLPERAGIARVGLLDYQDALAGHPAYDLVSLLLDARRDTAPELRCAMLGRYLDARPGLDAAAFRRAYAVLGVQRNLKIVGIFTRLAVRDGKPAYLKLIPRVWGHLAEGLAEPTLAPLADWVARHVPAPEPAVLARIAARVAA